MNAKTKAAIIRHKVRRAERKAGQALCYFNKACDRLFNDPMTAAIGAPTGDFVADFRRTARRMISKALRNPFNPPHVRAALEEARWEL